MQVTVFGIPNCSTVKKARDWLEHHQIAYEFYDFKKLGVDEPLIQEWLKKVSLNELINRSGMTFRKLSDEQKIQAENLRGAIELMMKQPSMIKRPILQISNEIYLGFKESTYQSIFQA
jgi:Spx/MgsR family transcriptional regulator